MVKILIVKPEPGSFRKLFSKLRAIETKNGPFDLHILLSDLFQQDSESADSPELDELLSNKIPIVVRTLCMMGQSKLPRRVQERVDAHGGLLCDKLEFLGPSSITTFNSLANLRIAVLSGVYDPAHLAPSPHDTLTSPHLHYISSQALSVFATKLQSQPIDILLTHSLPQLLTVHSKIVPKNALHSPPWAGCPPVTQVVRSTRPNYVFSAGLEKLFWEREPWIWDPDPHQEKIQITRFINLAQFGNPEKERWFYAFNLSKDSLMTRPPNATPSPYSMLTTTSVSRDPANKRPQLMDEIHDDSGPNFRFAESSLDVNHKKRARTTAPPQNYVCKICEKAGHWIQDCPENSKKLKPQEGYVCRICNVPGHRIQHCPVGADQKQNNHNSKRIMKEIGPDTCWFCLSNPQVAKHLVASIGNETYVSLPKGQLPDTSNSDCPVPGGGHVLLIPVAHYPSLLALPASLAIPIVSEIELYKSALRRCYAAYNASMVTFELAKVSGLGARAGHAHIQICPIPHSLADSVEEAFKVEGRKLGIDYWGSDFDLDNCSDRVQQPKSEELNYFKVGLPDGKSLVHFIKADERFNLQFGRLALFC